MTATYTKIDVPSRSMLKQMAADETAEKGRLVTMQEVLQRLIADEWVRKERGQRNTTESPRP